MAKLKPFPSGDPCPCGSSRRYGVCCKKKRFSYKVDKDGQIFRETPLRPEVKKALQEQYKRFAEKHGREPEPDEPIFGDLPPISEIADMMVKAGADPSLVYAYEKTGLLLTEDNRDLMPDADVRDFESAVEEFRHRKRIARHQGTTIRETVQATKSRDIVPKRLVDASRWQLTRSIRETLSDFVSLGTSSAVLLSASAPASLQHNVRAAVLAHELRLKSLDRVARRCAASKEAERPRLLTCFVGACQAAQKHLLRTFERLRPQGEPSFGVYAASIVLERLPTSIFAAQLLYSIGNLFEAHAVSRLILEQIAWAYKACDLRGLDEVRATSPQGAIGTLKNIFPDAGRIYGHLSEHAHIGPERHPLFLDIRDGRAGILESHGNLSLAEGLILLELSDFAAAVYEYSQRAHIRSLENWATGPNGLQLNASRKFVAEASHYRASFLRLLDREMMSL